MTEVLRILGKPDVRAGDHFTWDVVPIRYDSEGHLLHGPEAIQVYFDKSGELVTDKRALGEPNWFKRYLNSLGL